MKKLFLLFLLLFQCSLLFSIKIKLEIKNLTGLKVILSVSLKDQYDRPIPNEIPLGYLDEKQDENGKILTLSNVKPNYKLKLDCRGIDIENCPIIYSSPYYRITINQIKEPIKITLAKNFNTISAKDEIEKIQEISTLLEGDPIAENITDRNVKQAINILGSLVVIYKINKNSKDYQIKLLFGDKIPPKKIKYSDFEWSTDSWNKDITIYQKIKAETEASYFVKIGLSFDYDLVSIWKVSLTGITNFFCDTSTNYDSLLYKLEDTEKKILKTYMSKTDAQLYVINGIKAIRDVSFNKGTIKQYNLNSSIEGGAFFTGKIFYKNEDIYEEVRKFKDKVTGFYLEHISVDPSVYYINEKETTEKEKNLKEQMKVEEKGYEKGEKDKIIEAFKGSSKDYQIREEENPNNFNIEAEEQKFISIYDFNNTF